MPRFHHVNLGVPPGEIDSEIAFLVDMLGYRRAEKDERLGDIRVLWFVAEDGSEVHLSSDPDHEPASLAHVAISYGPGLADVENRLRAAEVELRCGERPGFPRIVMCRDPAGNLWELRGEMTGA